MRDITWRMGFTFLTLTVLAVLGLNVSCSPAHHLLEQALGRTPENEIDGYLEAIARGDRGAALELWQEPARDAHVLLNRRDSVTGALLARRDGLQYRILDVTWWRTCCEPAVIEDAAQAGGARIRVAIDGGGEPETVYLFDLLVPGGYWGSAAGNPVREWAIVDVYPEGRVPLAWQVGE